jgi:hypothetical protein
VGRRCWTERQGAAAELEDRRLSGLAFVASETKRAATNHRTPSRELSRPTLCTRTFRYRPLPDTFRSQCVHNSVSTAANQDGSRLDFMRADLARARAAVLAIARPRKKPARPPKSGGAVCAHAGDDRVLQTGRYRTSP